MAMDGQSFTPGKEPPYPLYRRLPVWMDVKKRRSLAPTGVRTSKRPARCNWYTDYSITVPDCANTVFCLITEKIEMVLLFFDPTY
jgi:hypothetical protein